MNVKRFSSENLGPESKRTKILDEFTYFHKCLRISGLTLKHPPVKCIALYETIYIIRNIKKNLEKDNDYPRNLLQFISNFESECHDLEVFKHYLYPNIIKVSEEDMEDHLINDSVIKILLSVPILQEKLIDYIFEKAIDLAAESKCGPWIQMILKCFSTLDINVNSDKMCVNLINLLDISTERVVRLEIITAIPDILEDQVHDSIATEMSRILSEDHNLIPAILDCLSYLCLSGAKYEELQKKMLSILVTLPKCNHFPNFVKFLLMPSHVTENSCFEAVLGLRNALGWPTSIATAQEIASSQVLTAMAIRNSMVSSKVVTNAWLKVISTCRVSTDYKPIDFVLLLILYSTSEERQKQVMNVIKKQIKINILKENSLHDTFDKFKAILKEFLQNLIDLTNSLLKVKTDPLVESFASYTYTLMLSKLDDCRQSIVAELLQLGLDCKYCVTNILLILNNIAATDMSLLKPQSLQMLTLLDRMDNMSVTEIRSVMNLVCGLSYTYENSVIRDDVHMVIKKELGSSSPSIKIQGILAGVYAVKYLAATHADEDKTVDLPDDVSYASITHLTDSDLREAVQIIELISQSTRQFSDMTAFFYDELSRIMSSANYINKHFMLWLTSAVTNDLQQNFIVDAIDSVGNENLKLSMQYCLNADSEVDEIIAINIAGLTLQSKNEIDVSILSSLFHLVQTLHFRQHNGDLSGIDALLGCPVVMPIFNIDLIEDMDFNTISNILDCLIHCDNWFRELLNAFAIQDDVALKGKILKRVLHIEELEGVIEQIIIKSNVTYKAPICIFDINKYMGERDKKQFKIQSIKQKIQKKSNHDDSVLPESTKTQGTQNNTNSLKNRIDLIENIPLRELSLSLLHLFNYDLSPDKEDELSIKNLIFLLKCVNNNLQNILISKIKRKTVFISKSEPKVTYDAKEAEECAKSVNNILPKMVNHLQYIVTYIESHTSVNTQHEAGFLYTSEMIDYVSCLEYIYNMFTIYFRWIGFKNHHSALLKTSLRTIATVDNEGIVSLKELLIAVSKSLQKQEKYCLQLSTAISLIEFLKTIQEHSNSTIIVKILKEMTDNFLGQQWKTPDGIIEKGLAFNQAIDRLTGIYFMNNEILTLKNLTLQLTNDIQHIKSRNDTLPSFKCINKGSFPILYRNLAAAVYESARSHIDKGLTNSEHLELWKDVAIMLKNMSEIAKTLVSRNNLSIFFKKSLPILKLFLSQGIPIIEKQFENFTQEVLEVLKILQQSTRFLQSLCCHSRLNKDTVLMSKVPQMRHLLETLIYKVKAALAANKCTEAFWMGNLKNKDIHGEIIATQQSLESEGSAEDCDDLLPEDDSEESDDEIINPDSNSISDIV